MIEGFYGRPWSHADRLFALERMGRAGMNTYVYAPKDDPLHLERWREPYSEQQMVEFGELVRAGERFGVRVGFAVSPGRSITYGSAEERALLVEKFRAFRELGSTFLSLALDDVPSEFKLEEDRRTFSSMAEAHALLTETLAEAMGPEVTLWLVPMDYIGVEATDYLALLGERLAPEIEIGWTGRTVVSPEIRSDEASQSAQVLQRKPLIWDNVPVNDGPMRSMLHLGPYVARDRDLFQHASGILLNPMEQSHASLISVLTAAEYLENPDSYDPEAAWLRAIEASGAGASGALHDFALAHRFSAQSPDDRDAEIEQGLERLLSCPPSQPLPGAEIESLQAILARRLTASPALRSDLEDRKLAEELEPWLASHLRETRRIESALNVLAILDSDAPRSAQTYAFMAMQGRFTLEPENGKISYGPRRAMYPQLNSMRDDAMGFGSDPVLFRDRSLADDFVALAESRALAALGGVSPNSG